jgi:hypothetical protein
MTGKGGYKEWGFRKIAWILDDLEVNIVDIYKKNGIMGLKKIKGIGEINANRIEKIINEKYQ